MGIACVSLRRGGTDHSFPYFNSGLLQQRGPPTARTPVKAVQKARSSPGQGRNITLNIIRLKCSVHAVRVCFIKKVVSCASVCANVNGKTCTHELKPWKVFVLHYLYSRVFTLDGHLLGVIFGS